jgi:predicted transcriptional regulator
MTAPEIARRLGISDRTVRRHLAARPARPTIAA